MQILIASDCDDASRRVAEMISASGLEQCAVVTVTMERAAERASRLLPDLAFLVLPDDASSGMETVRELRTTMPQLHILVTGPTSDAKLILKTLHEGADEYLDESVLESEWSQALVRFKSKPSNGPEPQQSGRVISVLAPSGGSGASTVAASLSTVLAKKYKECGLIDMRLAAGDLAVMLDLKPEHSLADMSDRLARLDPSMFEQFLTRHASGVCLLASPRDFAAVEKITGKAVHRILSLARGRFPFVVADVGNSFAAEQVEALWQSDIILLVLRLDYICVRNARRTLENLEKLGIGSDRVQLVANGYRQASQLRAGQAEDALGRKIAHYIPHDPRRVNEAINKGVPVVLHRPWSRVARSIVQLAVSVNGLKTK